MSKYADPKMLKQRKQTERDVKSPLTGLVFKIRKINVVDFIASGTLPLAEWAKGKEQDEIEQGISLATAEAIERDPALVTKLNDQILCLGVVTPKVVLEEAGEEEIFPEDLGDDQLWLVGEIMQFNGLLSGEQAESFRRQVLALVGRPVDPV